jgi:hypothetical protein
MPNKNLFKIWNNFNLFQILKSLVGLLFLGHSHVHTHSHSHEAKQNQEDEEDVVFVDQMKSVVSHSARSDFIRSVKEIDKLKEKVHQDTSDYVSIILLDSTNSVIKKKTGCNILCKICYSSNQSKMLKNN